MKCILSNDIALTIQEIHAAAMTTLASLFVSHGSPMMALEPGKTGALLRNLGVQLPRPKAILIMSPHWCTASAQVNNARKPRIIHDFGGFPEPLYALDYPATGSPELAERVATLLTAADIATATDNSWGLDHGAWVPLRYLYPEADIPVVQLSLQAHQPPAYHYRIGQLLAPLAQDNILLMGSGSFTHNLRELRPNLPDAVDPPHLTEFLQWFLQKMSGGDLEALFNYRHLAPHAVRVHPSDEHLLSLFFAMGAADEWKHFIHLDSGSTYQSLRMDAFAFGNASSALNSIVGSSTG